MPGVLARGARRLAPGASLWAHSSAALVGLALPPLGTVVRHISEEQLAGDADAVADLFERSLLKASRKKPEDGRPAVLTTRREALSLYREALRYSNLFVWRDERGRVWRDVIRTSTRQEFEAARFEQDPEIVNKLIITGRDCVHRTMETFAQRRRQIIEEEAAAQDGRPR